jgi:hypothetical protein
MKNFKISFFDTRLNIDRYAIECATNQNEAINNFQFRNNDYIVFKVEYIN